MVQVPFVFPSRRVSFGRAFALHDSQHFLFCHVTRKRLNGPVRILSHDSHGLCHCASELFFFFVAKVICCFLAFVGRRRTGRPGYIRLV